MLSTRFYGVSLNTVNTGTSGTISGDIFQVVSSRGSCTSVTADSNKGYDFKEWTEDYTGKNKTITITNVTGHMNINAVFEEEDNDDDECFLNVISPHQLIFRILCNKIFFNV